MKQRQFRQLDWLRAIVRFLEETVFTNPRVLHLEKEILLHYARLGELVTENHSVDVRAQAVIVRGRYGTKDTLREQQLLPLSRRGRKLARGNPELLTALKVPHKNASVDEMAAAAERIADALTPHLNVLIKAKFPRNCLTILLRDARALREHADEVQAARTLLGRSNREVTEELALARQTVNELDAVLRTLDDYSSFAFKWENANRIRPRMGRPSKRRLAARERSAARNRAREDHGPREASL
jgi:hypothetical protein